MVRSWPTASRGILAPGELSVIVNTGDDTVRHGLLVMPDHDAVMYMLAGLFDDERGWGIRGETWATIEMLEQYREDTWFRLGDRDLGTHIARNARLAAGLSITEAVLELQAALGISSAILPMTDEPVRTAVRTDAEWLDFQEYFVHRHQGPEVLEVRFDGIDDARPTTQVRAAIGAADVIVVGPSNPIVSLGPILAVPAMAELIGRARARGTPVVAVSGIIGGAALKGPADRMLVSLGHESSASGVARLLAPHSMPSCSTTSMPPRPPTSKPSACARSRPTRSWPMMPVAPGSRPMCSPRGASATGAGADDPDAPAQAS